MVKSLPPKLPLDGAPPLATANPPITLFTYAEVAKLARVGKQTVYEWVKTGRVPSPIYTGSTARFTEEHVNAILHERKAPGSYTVQPSPRADVGKLGAAAKRKKKKKKTAPAFKLSDHVATTRKKPPAAATPKGKVAKGKPLPRKVTTSGRQRSGKAVTK